jgi:hypothetical protein
VFKLPTQFQTPPQAWPLWTRNAFVVACIAALISSLYWARTLPSPFTPQENGAPFIVRDLPGKGKGMIALRDIKVGQAPSIHRTDLKDLLSLAWGALDTGKTPDIGGATK